MRYVGSFNMRILFFFFISSYIACDLSRSWRLNLQNHILSTVRERLVVDPPCPPPFNMWILTIGHLEIHRGKEAALANQ